MFEDELSSMLEGKLSSMFEGKLFFRFEMCSVWKMYKLKLGSTGPNNIYNNNK